MLFHRAMQISRLCFCAFLTLKAARKKRHRQSRLTSLGLFTSAPTRSESMASSMLLKHRPRPVSDIGVVNKNERRRGSPSDRWSSLRITVKSATRFSRKEEKDGSRPIRRNSARMKFQATRNLKQTSESVSHPENGSLERGTGECDNQQSQRPSFIRPGMKKSNDAKGSICFKEEESFEDQVHDAHEFYKPTTDWNPPPLLHAMAQGFDGKVFVSDLQDLLNWLKVNATFIHNNLKGAYTASAFVDDNDDKYDYVGDGELSTHLSSQLQDMVERISERIECFKNYSMAVEKLLQDIGGTMMTLREQIGRTILCRASRLVHSARYNNGRPYVLCIPTLK